MHQSIQNQIKQKPFHELIRDLDFINVGEYLFLNDHLNRYQVSCFKYFIIIKKYFTVKRTVFYVLNRFSINNYIHQSNLTIKFIMYNMRGEEVLNVTSVVNCIINK